MDPTTPAHSYLANTTTSTNPLNPTINTIPTGKSLTAFIRRLEAATSRLEDIALSASTFDPSSLPNNAGSSSLPTAASTKASASAPELPTVAPSISQQTVKPEAPPLPASIQDMDTLIDTEVKAFIDSSKGLDPVVAEQAAAVAKGFADQRRFLLVTTKAKRPDQSSQTFMDLLKDLQNDLGMAGDLKDSNRGSPMKEHLAMVAEGISTLQWLVLEGKPADTVAEMIGGAQMYGNRVLKAYKEGWVALNELSRDAGGASG
jgi:adenylyl cyclase-associated protein